MKFDDLKQGMIIRWGYEESFETYIVVKIDKTNWEAFMIKNNDDLNLQNKFYHFSQHIFEASNWRVLA